MMWQAAYSFHELLQMGSGRLCEFHKMYEYGHEVEFGWDSDESDSDPGYFLACNSNEVWVFFQKLRELPSIAAKLSINHAVYVKENVRAFAAIIEREFPNGTLIEPNVRFEVMSQDYGRDFLALAPRIEKDNLLMTLHDALKGELIHIVCDVDSMSVETTVESLPPRQRRAR